MMLLMRPYTHPPAGDFLLERVLYALSDPIRLGIVRHLAQLGPATCGELDGGRPKSTVSHHFKVTESSGTTHMNTLRRDDIATRFPGLLDAILTQPD
jgi:DNA-binding transcriptional ArsR family regulator